MRQLKASGDAKLFLGLLSLVLGGLAVLYCVNRAQDDAAVAGPEPIFVPAPVTFAPRLHLLGALSPSVAYLVETTAGLILIDAGLEQSHDLLLQQVAQLGLDIQDLKMILLTHGHGDHYLGAMKLKQSTDAKIYAGRGDADVLRQAGPREAVFSTFPMDHVHIHPTVVDVELSGDEIIELGDTRLKAIATPGHTPGSTCYLLERDGRTALFSGDTVMTITGDLGTYATYLPPRYRGNAKDYLNSLRKLQEMPVPDLLLPGHPRTNDRSISARITPQQWSQLLSDGIRGMEQLTARYAADGANFLDGHARELLPELFYLGDYADTAIYGFTVDDAVVLVDAPGDSGLVDFLEQQLSNISLNLSRVNAVVLTGVDTKSTAGLAAVIEKTGCRIIAAEAVAADFRRIHPDMDASILTATEAEVGMDMAPVSVTGFGLNQTAWELTWHDHQVLFTGRIPLKLTNEIVAELRRMSFDPLKWTQSLQQLGQFQPDLWLPARPVNGQMANLYDSDWQDVLRQNRLSLGLPAR